MPREEGSQEDAPLPPQQGLAVIEQMGSDDDEGISSGDEGEGFVQNGGYQLLAQDPDGPDTNDDDNDQEWETSPTTTGAGVGGSSTAGTDTIPASLPYDPTEMQQYAGATSSQPGSSTQPDIPQHLANLMPAQALQPDQSAKVSYSDTKETRESRKNTMAEDDKIKAAMSGFKLPGMAAPQWANFVSEDDWKNNLGARLEDSRGRQDRKQSGSDKSKSKSLEKGGDR